MFILEPNTNDHSLGTQIQLFSKAKFQGGSNLINIETEHHKSIVLKYTGQVVAYSRLGGVCCSSWCFLRTHLAFGLVEADVIVTRPLSQAWRRTMTIQEPKVAHFN